MLDRELTVNEKKLRFLAKWFSIALTLIVLYLLAFTYLIDKRPFVEWTLIKGSPAEARPSSQLIKLPDGKVFLLDADEASGSLLPYLKKQKIKDIDLLVLSSTSSRSISGLETLIQAGVRIAEVRVNSHGVKNSSWEKVSNQLSRKGIPILSLESGKKLFDLKNTQLEVIRAWNDAVVFRLLHGKNSLLLLVGEVEKGSEFDLKDDCSHLKSDILLNYTDMSLGQTLPDCIKSEVDLSRELGTFKILLKGDSFKWKRGR